MFRKLRLFLFGLAIFVLISINSPVVGIQQKIDEFPMTEHGTTLVVLIAYPDTHFHVGQSFEVSFTINVDVFGDMVEQIFINRLFFRLSVNFRNYSNQIGPFKIVSSDENVTKTFGFYLSADELGIFPGQFVGANVEYRLKWEERFEGTPDIEYDTDWRLIDVLKIEHSLLPGNGSRVPQTSAHPIPGFEIIPAIIALFILFWVNKTRKIRH